MDSLGRVVAKPDKCRWLSGGNSAWPISVLVGRSKQNFTVRGTFTPFLSKIE